MVFLHYYYGDYNCDCDFRSFHLVRVSGARAHQNNRGRFATVRL